MSLTWSQTDEKPTELLFLSSSFVFLFDFFPLPLIRENNEAKSIIIIIIILNINKPQWESTSYHLSLEFLF